MKPELLIATNGFKGTWPAIEYGTWVAAAIGASVTLLGVTEHLPSAPIDDKFPLEDIFARAVDLFKEKRVKYVLEIQNGAAESLIPRKAREKDFITVVGPLGRPPLRRLLVRRSIHHLMAEIPGPILYVPAACLPLNRLLICVGGLGYEVTAEHLAMRLAAVGRAEVTLLHVVPPMDLDYPTARVLREHWQDLIHTDTPPGRSLRQALETAQAAGLKASVKARQGNVVEEILAEIEEGAHDLICVGSAYSSHSLRQMYGPSVTDELAERARCPMLTARYPRGDVF